MVNSHFFNDCKTSCLALLLSYMLVQLSFKVRSDFFHTHEYNIYFILQATICLIMTERLLKCTL